MARQSWYGSLIEEKSDDSAGDRARGPWSRRLAFREKISDIKQIEDIAKEFGMDRDTRRDVGDWIESEKANGRGGTKSDRGDFTYRELRDKARDYMGVD